MEKSAAPKPVKQKNLRAFHSGGFVLVGAYIDFHFHICGLTQVPHPLFPKRYRSFSKLPGMKSSSRKQTHASSCTRSRQRFASSNWRVTGAAPESTGKVTHPQTESSRSARKQHRFFHSGADSTLAFSSACGEKERRG